MPQNKPHNQPSDRSSGFNSPGIIGSLIVRLLLTSLAIAVGGYVAFNAFPAPYPRIESWQGKVMYTLRWQLFSFFSLLVWVSVVAFTRLFTVALNPLDPRGDQYVRIPLRCLQNTLEQLALCVPAQLILSGYLESDSLRIIPILVILFVVGRIVFWVGYPSQRTYGFAMAFIPTCITYIADIFFFVTAGPAFRLTQD